jgi:hypothetical protein
MVTEMAALTENASQNAENARPSELVAGFSIVDTGVPFGESPITLIVIGTDESENRIVSSSARDTSTLIISRR